jgi:hypothetical protein
MTEKTEKDLAGKTAPPAKLYGPVSDADLKAIANKSEDDTNSYSKINKAIISKMKSVGKTLTPASNKDIKILKGE